MILLSFNMHDSHPMEAFVQENVASSSFFSILQRYKISSLSIDIKLQTIICIRVYI